jgi:aspartate/methionine/tyrosine aminotransferase
MSILSDRRNILVGNINEIEGISCPYPDGAFYAFANIKKTGMSSRQFTDFMFKHYVSVVSGDDFGIYGEGYVRLAFTESSINARIGLNRMETALTGASEMVKKTHRSDI